MLYTVETTLKPTELVTNLVFIGKRRRDILRRVNQSISGMFENGSCGKL